MMTHPTYREMLEEFLPDRSSPLYDINLNYAMAAIERGNTIADTVERLTTVSGSKMIDLGCGEGGVAIAFGLRGAEATALDLSPGRIERMTVRAFENNISVRGIVGNALETGLPDGHFDIVISNDVLEHVTEGQRLANEIDRILKPGGVLYLETQNRLSIFEFLSDSHLKLFGISLLPRKLAAFYAVKIRRRTKTYTVGNIPTPGYVHKIFKKTSIDLTQIHLEDPRKKISDPSILRSSRRRRVLVGLNRIGVSWVLMRIVESRLYRFIPGSIFFTGTKRWPT